MNSKLSVTDLNGHTTSFAYDSIQRLVKTTDAKGQETNLEYGANSGGVSVTSNTLGIILILP